MPRLPLALREQAQAATEDDEDEDDWRKYL